MKKYSNYCFNVAKHFCMKEDTKSMGFNFELNLYRSIPMLQLQICLEFMIQVYSTKESMLMYFI